MIGKSQAPNMWGRDMFALDVEVVSWAFTGIMYFVINFQNFYRE